VVPERDPAALASALADLAADPARAAALGRLAREEAVARHSWDAKAAELLAFLAPLARGAASHPA
jgi:glycosyltransferase involved in cell wall biosynthesis